MIISHQIVVICSKRIIEQKLNNNFYKKLNFLKILNKF